MDRLEVPREGRSEDLTVDRLEDLTVDRLGGQREGLTYRRVASPEALVGSKPPRPARARRAAWEPFLWPSAWA